MGLRRDSAGRGTDFPLGAATFRGHAYLRHEDGRGIGVSCLFTGMCLWPWPRAVPHLGVACFMAKSTANDIAPVSGVHCRRPSAQGSLPDSCPLPGR